ncbi:hypothetical protein JOC94_004090 [Bacillus thermophilus]|uniref:Uncharacterized protein n=1 Tax=Siminovitchia thermophila TaxID=1245522 RepID=A0ABS2RBP0_9BACI|nr:hypothetical protein [Siminovitchia thermophila]
MLVEPIGHLGAVFSCIHYKQIRNSKGLGQNPVNMKQTAWNQV